MHQDGRRTHGLVDIVSSQLAVDAPNEAPTDLRALEVGYREARLPTFCVGGWIVGEVEPDPIYFLDLVRVIAEPRLHSAEDDVSYLQVIPVSTGRLEVAQVVPVDSRVAAPA